MEIINENFRDRNSRDLGLGVRLKSCVTVQAPAQFGIGTRTHENDSTPCSEIMPYDMVQAGRQKPMCHGKHRQAGFTGKLHIRRVSRPGQLWKLWKLVGLSGHG